VYDAMIAILISHKTFFFVRCILTSWAYWHEPFTTTLMCSLVEQLTTDGLCNVNQAVL